MIFGSVCSGIEAASVAWNPLGWDCAFMSETAAFPRAVLKHHFQKVPCHGDFTTIGRRDYRPIDLLVGGTPCQSFSIAGLRGGMADHRGNLALEYLRLAQRLRPRWILWENVPGVLSSTSHDAPDPCAPPDHLEEGAEWVGEDEYDADENHAFSCFLAGLSELGYGWAYRSLDAQYFGLAQRRERVFVVGYLGDWRRAAAVLFEPASLCGDPAPSRKAGKDVAPTISARPTGGGGLGLDGELIARPLLAGGHANNPLDENLIAHALRADGFDAGEDGTGRGTPLVPAAFDCKAGADTGFAIGEIPGALRGDGHGGGHAAVMIRSLGVRRVTPMEAERLMGFPDRYTLIPYRGKPAADGPRYKALGNSMAVPVMRWIGRRIDAISKEVDL